MPNFTIEQFTELRGLMDELYVDYPDSEPVLNLCREIALHTAGITEYTKTVCIGDWSDLYAWARYAYDIDQECADYTIASVLEEVNTANGAEYSLFDVLVET